MHENATQALEGFDRETEVVGLTKGQFSLIDVIGRLLDLTGPAELVVSTWTAARKEIDDAARLLGDGRILELRWLVDGSFPRRQPDYCAALRERFGDSAIRVSENHAKFVLVLNDEWRVVVRTSMNLNRNPRLELFEVSHDPELAAFLLEVVDEVFEGQEEGMLDASRVEQKQEFRRFARLMERSTRGDDWGTDLDDALAPGLSVLDAPAATVWARAARMVRGRPGRTARELAEEAGLDVDSMRAALARAAERGQVRRGKLRQCRVGPLRALTWWPADG